MKILESPLMGEFIAYLKANWSGRSRVDQRRRRLRQLVAMVRAVADAAESRGGAAVRDGSLSTWLHLLRAEALRGQEVLDAAGCDAAAVAGCARRFLAGLRSLFVCSAEVERLTEAVEELERLAGPGGDLDLFVKVLRLEDVWATEMDVDGHRPVAAARHWNEASSSADSVEAGAGLPVPGVKRKRASTSVFNSVERPKRRVLAWMRPHPFAAPHEPPPTTTPPSRSRSHRAPALAMAMARVRRRIVVYGGKAGDGLPSHVK